ncbi:MAG TPA: hypothetical protein VFX98_03115 [Longimicrobiaceae bacterium]|nr:hypothetical protein [Longimicrobiaceae bacterium]
MRVILAFLADEANVSQDGKLNVLGIFDRIPAASFPALHPKMVFVFRVQAEPGDSLRAYPVRVRLLDDAGQVMFEANGELNAGPVDPDEFLTSNHVFSLVGVTFPRAGVYRFVVHVGALEAHETPFIVLSPATDSSFN